MFLSALQCTLRRALAFVLAGTLTATAWGQTAAQPKSNRPGGPKTPALHGGELPQGPPPLSQPGRALQATIFAYPGPKQHAADRAAYAGWQALFVDGRCGGACHGEQPGHCDPAL